MVAYFDALADRNLPAALRPVVPEVAEDIDPGMVGVYLLTREYTPPAATGSLPTTRC